MDTCDIGSRESEATTEPLRASELMLCIFFAIELIVHIITICIYATHQEEGRSHCTLVQQEQEEAFS